MPKQQWEDEARDRFVTFVHQNEGVAYRTAGEDVKVDGGKNFDYLLESNDSRILPIALEIFRLTPAETELKQGRAWSEIVADLKTELLARGIKDYLIRTPHFFVTRPKRREFVRGLADRLAKAIAEHAGERQFQEDAYVVTHVPGLAEPVFSHIGSAAYFDPVGIAENALLENIGDKNAQLNTRGRRRVILIVNWNNLVGSDSVLLACSRFDFASYTNVDQVYFEVAEGKLSLVFDRALYDRLEREDVSENDKSNAVFVDLVQVRLRDRDNHAF